MIINQAALKRPASVLVLIVFIVLAGASAYTSLPREDSPDITIPYIFVSTAFEGAAPKDMETLVTIPLERKLKGLDDLKELTSTSGDGLSLIKIEFTAGTDIDDALQKVRDKVDQAGADLPSDLEDDPEVIELNLSERPILNVVLSGPFTLKRLKNLAESLEDRIESVPGVLDAVIVGGLERQIVVEFDLDRVAFYGMPFSELLTALTEGNVNLPGGSMDIGDSRYLVRVPEDYQHPDEINSIVAFVRDGHPVYLRDVATIRDLHKDPDSRSRLDGQPSVTIQVKKRSGENIIEINDAVKAIVADMRSELPPTLKIDLTSDSSEDIRNMVSELENNIITGLVLVLAVVLCFIGGRSAIFVALSIPVSMLITFALLQAFSITLNMVVLFSLILALGMLVDNGIVMVENIYRHMQEGKSRARAALDASNEVAWPVITSTLTTVGAFSPMIFWPGIMGEFMSFLPITVIMALMGSLFVALVVNPVLSARWQTAPPATAMATAPEPRNDGEAKTSLADRFMDALNRAYRPILEWALDHRLATMGVALAFLLAVTTAFIMFGKGVQFTPESDPRRVSVNIKAPVGTNLDASDRLTAMVEKLTGDYPDIRHVVANVGESGASDKNGTHYSQITLDFKEFHQRERSSMAVSDDLRERLNDLRGAEFRVEKEAMGPPTGDPVNLEIKGRDMAVLGELVARSRKVMAQVPGLVDMTDDYVRAKPEIKVEVDKEKAALMGISTSTIAQTVKAAINGSKVGTYREGKDEYDIMVRLPQADRRNLDSLTRLTVSGPDGTPVPLTSLATIRTTKGLGGINHVDQQRVVTVSADVSGRLANEIIADIKAELDRQNWPRGYSYSFTGEQDDQREATDFLSRAFIAAVFIIFLVLVTQFNSIMTPFIILTSVVLSLAGVFLGLLVTGKPFGVIMTGVGVISLAGVVVNNAIVLIDYFEQLLARGLGVREALVRAGMTRLRPVLLTALTTILGLLPMATGVSFDFHTLSLSLGGESAQWWSGMAVAVIFGLAVATVLTLVVVPVLCSVKESLVLREKIPSLKTNKDAFPKPHAGQPSAGTPGP